MTGWLAGALARRVWTWVLVLGLLLAGLGRLLVALWRRPWLLWSLASVLFLVSAGLRLGATASAAVAVGVLLVLVAVVACWSWLGPGSFARRVADPLRSWRHGRHYAARWDAAMEGCGLIRADEVPTLMSCRCVAGTDRLAVHMAPGSLVTDWRDAAPRLASALEVRSVRVRRTGPRDVLLLVRRWVHAVDPGGDAVLVAGPEIPAGELAGAEPEPEVEAPRPAFPRRPS